MTIADQRWYKRSPWLALPCAVALAAWLVATNFPAGGNDDSHITYWAAHALAHLGRVVNYNGKAVEQSSSLGLVLLLGVIERALGATPPWSGWVVSIAGALAAIFGCAAIGRRASPAVGAVAPLLTATALPFLYWSTSGMEMTLAAALGLAVIAAVGEHVDRGSSLWTSVGAMAVFALVRPESPIVLICALVAAVTTCALDWRRARDATRLRRAVGALAIGVFLVATLAIVRYAAFRAVIPNPAAVKAGGFAVRRGVEYLRESGLATGIFFPIGVGAGVLVTGAAALRGRDATTSLTLGFALAGVAFVLESGGDWMPAGRLVVPVIPMLALVAAQAIAWLFQRQHLAGLAVLVLGIVVDVYGVLHFADSPQNGSFQGPGAGSVPGGLPADGPRYAFSEIPNRAHRRDMLLLGTVLAAAHRIAPTPSRPLVVMSGQAGMVPYYLAREYYGAFEFLDLFALTDTSLLACAPNKQRHPSMFGIHVSEEYLLSQAEALRAKCGFHRPDLVFSSGTFPPRLSNRGYKRIYDGPPRPSGLRRDRHEIGGAARNVRDFQETGCQLISTCSPPWQAPPRSSR